MRSARNGGSATVRSIPDIINMRGITDTIYGEVSRTFADKYNLRVRQEFEQYHDNPYGMHYRTIDGAGAVTADNRVEDKLGYTNWRTMVMFDSFLDKQTYVTADYMFNYLNNNSTRTNWRPVTTLYLKELDVDNTKTTNVYGLGYRRANILEVQNLDLSAGVRIEDSKTDSQSDYWINDVNTMKSNLNETRVAEVLRLVYKGIRRTTLSFDAKLEERQLNWDVRRIPTSTAIDRKADIYFMDQIYTFKAVHRFNSDIKSTVSFKIKDIGRNVTNIYDPSANYPGWLGDYYIRGSDVLVKTDFRLNNKIGTTLLYQYVQENIDFDLGGRTSDQEIHRGSGSISFNPAQNLFLVGTFMLENRTIDTPGLESLQERAYDFRGRSYSLLLDATYAFNEKTSCTLGSQHTEAMGNADASGYYVFDKVGLTLKHKLAANQTVGLGYQFYNFNSRNGDNLDYSAHGAFVTYGYTF